MRLTADEILEQYPSLNASGKHYDSVVARYYGDEPYGDMKPLQVELSDDDTINNIKAVDNWMVRMYPNEKVYKYAFCHGEGYIRVADKNGEDEVNFIGGQINAHYNGKTYHFSCHNHHMGTIHGWNVWTQEGGTVWIKYYATEGYLSPPTKFVHDVDKDLIEKILEKTKKDDEYGYFAQLMIKTIEEIGW